MAGINVNKASIFPRSSIISTVALKMPWLEMFRAGICSLSLMHLKAVRLCSILPGWISSPRMPLGNGKDSYSELGLILDNSMSEDRLLKASRSLIMLIVHLCYKVIPELLDIMNKAHC